MSHARRKAGLSTSRGDDARRESQLRLEAKRLGIDKIEASEAGGPSTHVIALMERERAASTAATGERSDGVVGGSGKVRNLGDSEWRYACAECGRTFLDNYHLKRHVKSIHQEPRPFKCIRPVATACAAASEPGGEEGGGKGGGVGGSFSPGGGGTTRGRKLASSAPEPEEAGRPRVPETDAGAASLQHKAGKSGGGGGREAGEGEADGGVPAKRVAKMCGAAFVKRWQLREHLYQAHGETM